MPMIDTDLLKPASDAVQAVFQAWYDAGQYQSRVDSVVSRRRVWATLEGQSLRSVAMSFENVEQVVEELTPGAANRRLRDGWVLLAVVPGYDHINAQPVACYVLGLLAEE